MILISNIGNRDVLHRGRVLERDSVRQIGEELFSKYDAEKDKLEYPLLEPLLEIFAPKLKSIYIFVTNQEDQRVRSSDTLFFGDIIKKWIEDAYNIGVNEIQYANNPTDYEKVYSFFTSYFTQEQSVIGKAEKRIISLSGGTPQMNGALYVILSSLYTDGNEFYNVFDGALIPVDHERTINRIFIKKSCIELLKINEYQSIIGVLNNYKIRNQESLNFLLNYTHFRKNFDFNKSQEYLEQFLRSIPSSEHEKYAFLTLENMSDPENLIKELFWNMKICYKNHNYLFLVALLFRLEEALLHEINDFFFKEITGDSLHKKKTHVILLKYLEKEEPDLWNALKNSTFRKRPLDLNLSGLNRTVLFFIAQLKVETLKRAHHHLYQIEHVLEILDRINKYTYDTLEDNEKERKYGLPTGTKCLGDLRNSSLIAHGFESVSRQKIEGLYKENLDEFMENLELHARNLLGFLTNNRKYVLDNPFDTINQRIKQLILKL